MGYTKGGCHIANQQYAPYHVHSDISNGTAKMDSVTKYWQYIEKAKECGMKAFAFAEHGSIFEWYHKKTAIESAGMKYIHAVEAYITESLTEKVRDNYHCVLLAKNYEGFLELNRLVSGSFNRNDGHYYYAPRILFDDLLKTSENIIISTACIGSILGKAEPMLQQKFIHFLIRNKERCFLEIGHHPDQKQLDYNQKLYQISQETGIRLIAGTDTHALNELHSRGRKIYQKGKDVKFAEEDNWDLTFKTYTELVDAFRRQGCLPPDVYLQAIENTNVMADMVEEFVLDLGAKYPKISENPDEAFLQKITEAVEKHPYALERHGAEKLWSVIDEEIEVYKATNTVDFMLLQTYLREWEAANGIFGSARGSASGSIIAYLLRVTDMDSIKFDLNFFRFLNPDRVTNADIDTDYGGEDRVRVKEFLLKEKMNLPTIQSAEIITFNTVKTKGAIRDIGKALEMDRTEIAQIAKIADSGSDEELQKVRRKYKELFEYVDLVEGVIVSIGSHPGGVLLSDLEIAETIGLCSTKDSPYPVTMLNMLELDALMYVKLDILGVDNIGVLNKTCKLLGIERRTADNIDLEDDDVWDSIREDTTLIFQWEGDFAREYIKRLFSEETMAIAKKRTETFSRLKWLSLGSGLLRPAGASIRDSIANGEFYDNGFKELNDMLTPEAGRITMQETIMNFLVRFCGYSGAESDTVRRAIAKKKGTEKLLPEIKDRFISYSSENYEITTEKCAEEIEPILQIILDASDYGFTWNHSDAYSALGYICGYLRHYHPLEFLTTALNVFEGKEEKTAMITKYATKRGIAVTLPKWGLSRSEYFFDRERDVIAKGLSSVKYMNATIADELYNLSKKGSYQHFMDLLYDIHQQTSVNSRQLEILIQLDFFAEFGNQRELLKMVELFKKFKEGDAKQIKKTEVDGTPLEAIVQSHAIGITKSGGEAKSYKLLDVMSILLDAEKLIKSANVEDIGDVVKVKNFIAVMGYMGYVSGKEHDRPKLYISKIYPLKRKKDGVQFGYSILTKSIGSGVEARFTVFNNTFKKEPIAEGDIIHCRGYEREGIYFKMTAYSRIL